MDNLDYDPNDPNSILKYLRLSNIFAPSPGGSDSDSSQVSPQDVSNNQIPNQPQSGIDINSIIQKLMTPNEDMFNKMKSQVDSMPIESNFKDPSLWTKIRAHLAAMGADNPTQAGQVVRGIEHGPYLKALSEWKQRLEPTEKLAQFENTRNVNDRLTGTGILRDEQASRKQAETERKNQIDEERKKRETDLKERRTAAYEFKSTHPDYKSATDNGELVFYNPKDPTQVIHSGMETGKMNDIDKINLEHEGRLEEIQARGKVSAGLESQKQTGRETLEGQKQTGREALEGTKQTGRETLESQRETGRKDITSMRLNASQYRTGTTSESQRKIGLIAKAQKIIAEHPELKRYYTFEKNNSNNIIDVKVPPSVIFGDEEKRMKAYNLLYAQEPVPGFGGSSGSNKNVTPQSNGAKPTTRTDGKTHVKRKSDGQVGWVTNPDMSKYDLEP